jgi:Domain of unknown function (DUF5667)
MPITITTILLVFSLILGGTSATVYAAQDSLPEQPLYAIKILSEDLAVQIPQPATNKIDLHLDFADRRVAELVALARSSAEPKEDLVYRLEFHLDRALQQASEMEGDQMVLALSQVQARLEKQSCFFTDQPLEGALMIRSREAIQIRLRWAEFGLDNPRQFRQQAQERHHFHQPPDSAGDYGPGPNPVEPGGYGPGPNLRPGVGDGNGPGPYATGTPSPSNGYGPGPGPDQIPGDREYGPGPYPTSSPTPGNGYGPGPGYDPSQTPGTGDGNGPGPYVTGTPTPGSGYGPGPGPDPTCTCPNPDPGHDDGGGSVPNPPDDRGNGGNG